MTTVGLAGLCGEFVRLEQAAGAGAAGGWGLRLDDGFAVPLPSGMRVRIEAAAEDRLDAGPLEAVLTRVNASWVLVDGEGYWSCPSRYLGRECRIVG